MKIMIDIGHPAHVHLFKHFAWQMQDNGHQILFTERIKEVTTQLLKAYGFPFVPLGRHFSSKIGKIWGLIKSNCLILKTALKFKPDLFFSHGSFYAAQVSWLLRKPHISMEDTGNLEQVRLYLPFTEAVLTSTTFHRDFGEKQITYRGYHELCYLHPNHFKPDPSVIGRLGLKTGERFIILRFVSWTASHDVGQKGLSFATTRKAIEAFSKFGRVFISSEGNLPGDLIRYKIEIPPERMHDALAYASLYIGDSPTMAEESAILGTPAVCVSSWAGDTGVIKDLQAYDLLYCYKPEYENRAVEKALELLKDENAKSTWKENCRKMLSEKIDVTAFMVWFIENYPGSVKIMKENPGFQERFK